MQFNLKKCNNSIYCLVLIFAIFVVVKLAPVQLGERDVFATAAEEYVPAFCSRGIGKLIELFLQELLDFLLGNIVAVVVLAVFAAVSSIKHSLLDNGVNQGNDVWGQCCTVSSNLTKLCPRLPVPLGVDVGQRANLPVCAIVDLRGATGQIIVPRSVILTGEKYVAAKQ